MKGCYYIVVAAAIQTMTWTHLQPQIRQFQQVRTCLKQVRTCLPQDWHYTKNLLTLLMSLFPRLTILSDLDSHGLAPDLGQLIPWFLEHQLFSKSSANAGAGHQPHLGKHIWQVPLRLCNWRLSIWWQGVDRDFPRSGNTLIIQYNSAVCSVCSVSTLESLHSLSFRYLLVFLVYSVIIKSKRISFFKFLQPSHIILTLNCYPFLKSEFKGKNAYRKIDIETPKVSLILHVHSTM